MPQPVTREDFVADLATLPPEALRGLLQVTGYGVGDACSSEELARRVAACLWWSWSTPLGYAARRASLDAIVDDVAARLDLGAAIRGGDAWERLDRLRAAVLDALEPAPLEALDEGLRRKLGGPSWFPSIAGAGGAGGAYGAGRVGAWVLRLGAGPIGRLLPLTAAAHPGPGALLAGHPGRRRGHRRPGHPPVHRPGRAQHQPRPGQQLPPPRAPAAGRGGPACGQG